MADSARDNTQDWLVPERAAPASIAELEDRIDVAIAIARSSEAAVMTVADAAIESAEQARRAAELAERAADAAAEQRSENGRESASAPELGEPEGQETVERQATVGPQDTAEPQETAERPLIVAEPPDHGPRAEPAAEPLPTAVQPLPSHPEPGSVTPAPNPNAPDRDEWLEAFQRRADRLGERFAALQRR